MGFLLYRYFPNARGSGVPQTKAALFARDGFISLRTVLGKFFCTATTLASGIPLGREGPSVQVGAGIGSVLGRWLGLRPEKVKALIPVGAAAAIAAAFNTPMAAVLFSLEEVVGDMHAPILGSVVLASATSWAVLRLLLGNNPLFQCTTIHFGPSAGTRHLRPAGHRWWLSVRGLHAAFVGNAQVLSATAQEYALVASRSGRRDGWPDGMVCASGPGRRVYLCRQCPERHHGAQIDAAACRAQAALESPSVMPQGTRAESLDRALFLGAMLGGAIGTVAHNLLPGYTATPGAYALVGMGALFAGIVRAPMTSVLMIFEMTRDYAVIVPLMIANLTSFFISSHFQKQPIYDALARQDGIHLPSHSTRDELSRRTVAQIMRNSPQILPAQMRVEDAIEQIRSGPFRIWPVADKGYFLGILNREELERAFVDGRREQTASEPCRNPACSARPHGSSPAFGPRAHEQVSSRCLAGRPPCGSSQAGRRRDPAGCAGCVWHRPHCRKVTGDDRGLAETLEKPASGSP